MCTQSCEIKPGGESHTLPSNEDIAPTLLPAAGPTPGPKTSDRRFLGLPKGEVYAPRRHLFVERGLHATAPRTVNIRSSSYDLGRAGRGERFKAIHICTPGIPCSPVDAASGAA